MPPPWPPPPFHALLPHSSAACQIVSNKTTPEDKGIQAMLRQVVLAGKSQLVPFADLDRLVARRVAADGLPLRAVDVDGAVCAVDGARVAD